MQMSITQDSNRITLKVSGSLTFADNREWRTTTTDFLDKSAEAHLLDLVALEDLDSAGLGMMLALQKWAKDKGRVLKVKYNAESTAGSMIRLAKLDSVFTIVSE